MPKDTNGAVEFLSKEEGQELLVAFIKKGTSKSVLALKRKLRNKAIPVSQMSLSLLVEYLHDVAGSYVYHPAYWLPHFGSISLIPDKGKGIARSKIGHVTFPLSECFKTKAEADTKRQG